MTFEEMRLAILARWKRALELSEPHAASDRSEFYSFRQRADNYTDRIFSSVGPTGNSALIARWQGVLQI